MSQGSDVDPASLDLFSVSPYVVPMDNKLPIKVHTCPICGSTELVGDIVVTIRQDLEGQWNFIPIEQLSLNDSMQETNNEVRCMNEYCGPAYDENDEIIHLEGEETLFDYWVRTRLGATATALVTEENLSEEDKQAFGEWSLEVHYKPWSGCIGDCTCLSL